MYNENNMGTPKFNILIEYYINIIIYMIHSYNMQKRNYNALRINSNLQKGGSIPTETVDKKIFDSQWFEIFNNGQNNCGIYRNIQK